MKKTTEMKKTAAGWILTAALGLLALTGCSGTGKTEPAKSGEAGAEAAVKAPGEESLPAPEDMSFEEMKEAARGTTVTFYGWGGDEKLNDWLDHSFAPVMKEKYDITMERVPMDLSLIHI